MSWLRKGAEAKGYDRFIYRWISLEALCGVLKEASDPTKPTESLINEIVSKLKDSSSKDIIEKNKEAIEQLVEANLVGRGGAKRSHKLKRAIETNAGDTAILQKILLCVYEVRNRLLHRGERLSMIDGCNALLRDLIHTIINDLLENPPNPR